MNNKEIADPWGLNSCELGEVIWIFTFLKSSPNFIVLQKVLVTGCIQQS